jgi:hypothetical protein
MDVAPTVLALLHVPTVLPSDELRFGRNAFDDRNRRVAPFACWNDGLCEGYVDATTKVVRLPSDHRSIAFDRDRDEWSPRSPSPVEEERVDDVHDTLVSTRLDGAPVMIRRLELPSGFVCGPPGSCVHPNRPNGGFHQR